MLWTVQFRFLLIHSSTYGNKGMARIAGHLVQCTLGSLPDNPYPLHYSTTIFRTVFKQPHSQQDSETMIERPKDFLNQALAAVQIHVIRLVT